MAKFQSPLLGYNNNVRHKNRVFHIQTEDSGVNHPHIITHLFMDGGRILKSVKRSYAEHVGAEGMSETVRQLMKEQHKAMFIALRDGQFDHLVGGDAAVPSAASKEPAPATVKMDPEPAAASATQEAAPSEVDLDQVEREAQDRQAFFNANDLPPPPKSAFAKEAVTGAYRTAPQDGPKPSERAPARPPTPPGRGAPPAAPAPAARPPAGESRYAPARPAAIFGSTIRPQAQSMFTDEMLGDKSLDEVILSYLAEDLEPARNK